MIKHVILIISTLFLLLIPSAVVAVDGIVVIDMDVDIDFPNQVVFTILLARGETSRG